MHDALALQSYTVHFAINSPSARLRQLNLIALIRTEIELYYIGRKYIVEKFDKPIKLIVLSMFVDSFRVYRNMYRAILGVYLNCMSLLERQRNRKVNIFPLILSPHTISFIDIMHSLLGLTEIDQGAEIDSISFIYTPILFQSGNIKQQQENAGYLRLQANRLCRLYYAKGPKRSDLDFNIRIKGRYYYLNIQQRQTAKKLILPTKAKTLSALGFIVQLLLLLLLTLMLDFTRLTSRDPAYSKY